MDFLIPARMLKPDQWNSIQIHYESGYSNFGLKVNKSYFDDYTKLPILDLRNDKRFRIALDSREVVDR